MHRGGSGMTEAMETRGRRSRTQIFQRLVAAVEELDRYGGMPNPQEASEIWDNIWHLEAHNSTAIEGNTLVLREVRNLLEQGRAVGGKALKDYLEVEGYADAAKWVYSQAQTASEWSGDGLLTVTEIRTVHELVMTKVWAKSPHPEATSRESPGGFRRHDIHPFSSGMTPPSWVDVPPRLTTWVEQANELGEAAATGLPVDERVIRLADLHSGFERIHPFIDGNGRTGRLTLNLMLVRLGWPPVIVFKQDRNKYLRALDRSDKGDSAPLAEVLSRSIIDNLHRFVVPNVAGPARLVPLEALATEEIGYTALRQAATRGRLEASRASDGSWRATRHAVERYLASRYRRGDSS